MQFYFFPPYSGLCLLNWSIIWKFFHLKKVGCTAELKCLNWIAVSSCLWNVKVNCITRLKITLTVSSWEQCAKLGIFELLLTKWSYGLLLISGCAIVLLFYLLYEFIVFLATIMQQYNATITKKKCNSDIFLNLVYW